ncbi:MAG TPA: hypothetical protein DD716_06320 [Thiomicrospira sp.]|nr:hypothetical protein [Thiomicrospira sp.]
MTDHEDTEFQHPFSGFDINLTGVGFIVNSNDFFLPDQEISLRVKNTLTNEQYCLEGVLKLCIFKPKTNYISVVATFLKLPADNYWHTIV